MYPLLTTIFECKGRLELITGGLLALTNEFASPFNSSHQSLWNFQTQVGDVSLQSLDSGMGICILGDNSNGSTLGDLDRRRPVETCRCAGHLDYTVIRLYWGFAWSGLVWSSQSVVSVRLGVDPVGRVDGEVRASRTAQKTWTANGPGSREGLERPVRVRRKDTRLPEQ
uniref:Uncharacterized protein n=1 Tax=Timema douglasi TaxID=61478 RepID=A0A7R8ZDG6_TIMDO|nr:unnamed protein product [Timema douglasi]